MPIPLLQILRSIKETKDIGQIQTLLKKPCYMSFQEQKKGFLTSEGLQKIH